MRTDSTRISQLLRILRNERFGESKYSAYGSKVINASGAQDIRSYSSFEAAREKRQ